MRIQAKWEAEEAEAEAEAREREKRRAALLAEELKAEAEQKAAERQRLFEKVPPRALPGISHRPAARGPTRAQA